MVCELCPSARPGQEGCPAAPGMVGHPRRGISWHSRVPLTALPAREPGTRASHGRIASHSAQQRLGHSLDGFILLAHRS